MIEIVRGRTWRVDHRLYDDLAETAPTDLSQFSNFRSQLRERIATKQADGCFHHKLIANITVEAAGNVLSTSLTREQTYGVAIGTYQFDVIAEAGGLDVELLGVTLAQAVNKSTSLAEEPEELPACLPPTTEELDPVGIFNTALVD